MVQDVLPEKLSATVNGEAVELTLGGWSCPDYPAAGCYQGTYTFTTTLPEGYELGEDVAALEIPVIFMDGTSQWNGTESSVSYIGSDNTPGTCETYTAVTDADAATWSDGWYVVSGRTGNHHRHQWRSQILRWPYRRGARRHESSEDCSGCRRYPYCRWS